MLVLLVAIATALAGGIPFELPPEEAAAVWRPALDLGGFVPGQATGAPAVVLVHDATWRLRVTDAHGGVREVPIDDPDTPADREDVVWLATALLHGSNRPAPVAVPEPPPAPPPVLPRPRPKPPPVVVVEPPPPEPPVVVVAVPAEPPPPVTPPPPVAPEALVLPLERLPRVRTGGRAAPYVRTVGSITANTDVQASASADLEAGVTLPNHWIGVAIGIGTRSRMSHLAGARYMQATSLLGTGAVRVWRTPVIVGGAAGLDFRGFTAPGVFVARGAIPVVRVETSLDLPLAFIRPFVIAPLVRVQTDLRRTSVAVDGAREAEMLSPFAFEAGIALRFDGVTTK